MQDLIDELYNLVAQTQNNENANTAENFRSIASLASLLANTEPNKHVVQNIQTPAQTVNPAQIDLTSSSSNSSFSPFNFSTKMPSFDINITSTTEPLPRIIKQSSPVANIPSTPISSNSTSPTSPNPNSNNDSKDVTMHDDYSVGGSENPIVINLEDEEECYEAGTNADLRNSSQTGILMDYHPHPAAADLTLSQMMTTTTLEDHSQPSTPFQPLSASSLTSILYDDDEEEPPAKSSKRKHGEVAKASNPVNRKILSDHINSPTKTLFRTSIPYIVEQKLSPQPILVEIVESHKKQKMQLDHVRSTQRQVIEQRRVSDSTALDNEQKILKSTIDNQLKLLYSLYETSILKPSELHRWDFLRHELEVQQKHAEVLMEELSQFMTNSAIRKPAVSLMITRQPFPQVPPCKEQLNEDSLVLRIIQGACVKLKSVQPVKAALIMENHPIASHKSAGVKDEKMLEGEIQPFDMNAGVAKFPLTFLKGTRKNTVNLRFSVQLDVEQAGTVISSSIESNSSQPFVVMTNQKQWEACEGTLLKKDAFGERLEITWPQFANALQKQFLRATKQDPMQPTRHLSHYDFEYIRSKFFPNDKVTQKEFEAFWLWFGKCIQVLRYQRHIGSLWMSGYVIGFMTREDVTSALEGQLPGTFLIRFSESNPGQFGIAYMANEEPPRIKHYLVQPNDTAAAKVTLADFCKDKPQFSHILQLSIEQNQPILIKQPKHQALNQYYSKRVERPTVGSGYEPL